MTHVLSYAPDAEFAKDMGTIDASGAGWIRVDINWAVIQRNGPTFFDWAPFDRIVLDARARGMNVLGMIVWTPAWARPSPSDHYATPAKNTADFANFAWTAVKRYSAMGVHTYEVWNEPNLAGFWQPAADPVRYTELLKAAYLAIKQADPLATVVSGGLSPALTNGGDIDAREFAQAMYANGAQGYFDALGHHPYSHPAAPGDAQNWSGWYQMYGAPNNLRSQMIANGDGNKQIWGTEFGFATNGPPGSYVSETEQAQHLTKAYELFGTYSWAGPLFLWAERDYGTDPGTNYNFYGLTRKNFSAKPSLAAYQAAATVG
jgi:polysaccharide biosynthesis protein PslG